MKNTVTPEQVKENMQDVIVRTLVDFDKPTTYVTIRMKNGFTLRESTTCVDPKNYNEEIGKEICLKKLEDKVWLLLGYQLQEELYQSVKHNKKRMKYLVEFRERATLTRLIQCEIEAEDEKEVEEKVKTGDYQFIDSWDEDDLGSEFLRITDIQEADEDD